MNITKLRAKTLMAVRDVKVFYTRHGNGAWRIWGGDPGTVGLLKKNGLIDQVKVDDDKYVFVLTEEGKAKIG